MLKDKITNVLNEMGGGAGISVTCDASDLSIPDVSVSIVKGRMVFKNISTDGTFPMTVHKFSATGYQDGMSDVKGSILTLVGQFPDNFKQELQKQIQASMSGINEDIFKPATGKEIEKRRKSLPLTVHFEIDTYSGELSDVVGGGYSRPGPKGFMFDWKDVGLKAYLESRYDAGGNTEGESYDLEGFNIQIRGSLTKEGQAWYMAVFNPPDYDPKDYDSEQFGNDPGTTMPEEMYWDMYWEDIAQEWGA